MVVEGCVKVLEAMYGRGRKLLKLHWLKHPKTVPKNEILTRKKLIQYVTFGVFLLISDFLAESLRPNKN